MGKIVEILLEEIYLKDNGKKLTPGKNYLIMELIAPRSGEPSIVRTIELDDIRNNVIADYIVNPYKERICFKEEVIGTFGISIKITSQETSPFMVKLLEKAYKTLLPGGSGYLAGGVGSELLAKPLETVSTGMIDEIIVDEDRTYIIGEGYADFESSKMPSIDHWKFDLNVKKNVLIQQMAPIFGENGGGITRELKTFAKLRSNENNGFAKFEVHVY